MNIIVFSIPLYFLFIGIEGLVGWRRGQRIFRGADVATNLMLGLAQTVFAAAIAWFIVGNYARLYGHHLLTISSADPLAWIILFVGQDFLYYWFHRASHELNVGWAGHVPHHQSEDFNFAVALRQGPFQPLISSIFYLPLAFVGFPPEMFATVVGINTVYQFFLHTELVRTLGPLEWILNTPSHHRVHHGCNGRYLDKNHGAILIIWDRLFGTFEPEAGWPVYGTVKPIASFNPLTCALTPLVDLVEQVRSAPRFRDKLVVWFKPPAWRPEGLPQVDLDVSPDRPKYQMRLSRARGAYVAVAFMAATGVSLLYQFQGIRAPVWAQLIFVAWFVATLGGLGGVIEGRKWANVVEALRHAVTPFVIMLLLG